MTTLVKVTRRKHLAVVGPDMFHANYIHAKSGEDFSITISVSPIYLYQ